MIGDQLRENLLKPELGGWYISTWMMGECVPLGKKSCSVIERSER
jgi:hypothetical protein